MFSIWASSLIIFECLVPQGCGGLVSEQKVLKASPCSGGRWPPRISPYFTGWESFTLLLSAELTGNAAWHHNPALGIYSHQLHILSPNGLSMPCNKMLIPQAVWGNPGQFIQPSPQLQQPSFSGALYQAVGWMDPSGGGSILCSACIGLADATVPPSGFQLRGPAQENGL